jgi:hypothetical protein
MPVYDWYALADGVLVGPAVWVAAAVPKSVIDA